MDIKEIREKFPQYNDMSDDALVDALHKKYYSDIPFPEFIVKMGLQKYDPTTGMSKPEQFMAGLATAPTNRFQGVKQLFGHASKEDVQQQQREQKPLMDTTWGKFGNQVGNAGLLLGTALIPGSGSILGSTITGLATGLTEPVAEGDVAETKTERGAYGALAGFGSSMALHGASDLIKRRLTNLEKSEIANKSRDETFKAAREEGYVIPPGYMGKISLAEGLGGKQQTAQLASERNQVITNELALKDLDDLVQKIKPGESIKGPSGKLEPGAVHDAVDKARQAAWDIYDDVGKAGVIRTNEAFQGRINELRDRYTALKGEFPSLANKDIDELIVDLSKPRYTAAGAKQAIMRLRNHANLNYGNRDPKVRDLGEFQRQAANALEDLVDANLSKPAYKGSQLVRQASPDLVDKFRNARTLLAKARDIEDAMRGGDVVAAKLGAKLDKKAPLSGRLKTIARTERQFDKAMKPPAMTSTPEFSPLDMAAGAIVGGGQRPELLGAILGRPVARRMALSNFVQNRLLPNYSPGLLGPLSIGLEDPLTSALTRGLLFERTQ